MRTQKLLHGRPPEAQNENWEWKKTRVRWGQQHERVVRADKGVNRGRMLGIISFFVKGKRRARQAPAVMARFLSA
jgi:hypothetical protein